MLSLHSLIIVLNLPSSQVVKIIFRSSYIFRIGSFSSQSKKKQNKRAFYQQFTITSMPTCTSTMSTYMSTQLASLTKIKFPTRVHSTFYHYLSLRHSSLAIALHMPQLYILYTYMLPTNFGFYPFLVTLLSLIKFLHLTMKEVQLCADHSYHLLFDL